MQKGKKMKRTLLLACVFTLVFSALTMAWRPALADGISIDFSTATDEELENAILKIREEQSTRTLAARQSGEKTDDRGRTLVTDSGIALTVLDVKQQKGEGYAVAEDGKIFVLIELQIENLSGEEIMVNSIFGFDTVCDSYNAEYSLNAEMNADSILPTTELAPGKILKGQKAYEVPEDWKEIDITFKTDMISGEKIEFVLYNESFSR